MKMHSSIRNIVVIIVLLQFTSPQTHLFSQKKNLCDITVVQGLIKNDTETYRKRKKILRDLMQGTFEGKFDLASVFSFDIQNKKEKEQYLEKINKNKTLQFETMYPQCVDSKKKLIADFNALKTEYEETIKLEIYFLTLPPEQRTVLINLNRDIHKSNIIIRKLRNEQQAAIKEQYEALESIKVFTRKKSVAGGSDMEQLYTEIVMLEKLRAQLSYVIIDVAKKYEDQYTKFKEYGDRLNDLVAAFQKQKDKAGLLKEYASCNAVWREIIDIGIKRIDLWQEQNLKQKLVIPQKAQFSSNIINEKDRTYYFTLYKHISDTYEKFITNQKNRQQQLIKTHYSLVRDASNVRSKFLLVLKNNHDYAIFRKNPHVFVDLLREIKIVPYRLVVFFVNRWIDFKHNTGRGITGMFELIKSILLLVFIVGAPFLIMIAIKRFSRFMEKYRLELMNIRKPTIIRVRLSYLLRYVNPYLPFILAYAGLFIISGILKKTLFEEVLLIIPYIKMYIIYRFFISFFDTNLKKVIIKSNMYSVLKYEAKITRTGKVTGLWFLMVFIIQHITDTSVGKAYVYLGIQAALYFFSIVIIILAVYSWRAEISAGVIKVFVNRYIVKLAEYSKNIRGLLLSLPLLVLLITKTVFMMIAAKVSQFEFAKKTIARLLRKQIEAAGAEVQSTDIESIPNEYRALFSLGVPKSKDLWIVPHEKELNKAVNIINQWSDGKTEEISLAVYGEKGIGKSTFIEIITDKITSENNAINIVKIIVPSKTTTSSDVVKMFEEILGIALEDNIENIINWDKNSKKTVLFLENAHNLFISEIGGFEGFKTFLKLINQQLDNLFICATFNLQSWIYLDGVFYKNKYFRNIISLGAWCEEDIRSLVTVRNNMAKIKLKYDRVISASLMSSEVESIENIEKRFFRLLWEQSEGNPRAAIYSWLTCLTPGTESYTVGLPLDPEINILKDVQFEALFIYASIAKHENISMEELTRSTDLPRGLIKYAIKVGIERDFIYRDEVDRFQINPAWHSIVINYLRQRNLLYVS